jgi:hypothetical protein
MVSLLAYADARDTTRATIALDDDLVKKAVNYTGIKERAALVSLAFTRMVQQEAPGVLRPWEAATRTPKPHRGAGGAGDSGRYIGLDRPSPQARWAAAGTARER